MTKRTRRRWHWPRITRDTVTLMVGAGVFSYETVVRYPSDPTIVSAAVFLMITPVALRLNDAFRSRDTSEGRQARGYYRVLEDEKRWEQDWDRRRSEMERRR